MIRCFLMAVVAVLPTQPVAALELLRGSAPAPIVREFAPTLSLDAGQELVISGTNDSPAVATLVVRIDDVLSDGYAGRVNEERPLPPGRFTIRLPMAGLRTPSGRTLDVTGIRRLFVFPAKDGRFGIDRVGWERNFSLPAGAAGWDFGPPGGAVFPGFQAILPDDSRLAGRQIRAVSRPGGDSLIADGLVGVERFSADWPSGRWRVSIWTEDLGEWEYLPPALTRRVRVNGLDLADVRLSPNQWLRQRYLAGRVPEVLPGATAWSALGIRRGGLVSGEVDIHDGRLVLELAGADRNATFISGLLIEPAGGRDALNFVQQERGRRFDEEWRVATEGAAAFGGTPKLWRVPAGQELTFASRPPESDTATGPIFAAPDSLIAIDLAILSAIDTGLESLRFDPPSGPGGNLEAELRAGHWRFRRADGVSKLLVARAHHLRADLGQLRLHAGVPRRYSIVVRIPPDVIPGRYLGRLSTDVADHHLAHAVEIEVLPVTLPRPDVPIGVYLDRPPHFEWFPALERTRAAVLPCDLDVLRRLGMSGIAPPLDTPIGDGKDAFVAQLAAVSAVGFAFPALAYAPLKRLVDVAGDEKARDALVALHREQQASGQVPPIWSVADEPSNPGAPGRSLVALSRLLKDAMPNAKRAAHLNNPADRRFLPDLDIAIVNAGFGADASDIGRIRRSGAEAWLYNLEPMRMAAGFYLWRVGGQGYLQWHARMPTADPFDPTDGREDDHQFLYPDDQPCQAWPDLHGNLLDLAEGIMDRRWLQWLDLAAERYQQAAELRDRLHRAVPSGWRAAASLGVGEAARWRAQITELAWRLRSGG